MIIMWKTSFFSFSIGRAKKCVVMSETRGSKARCKTRERVKEVQDEINSNVETHAIFFCFCCAITNVYKKFVLKMCWYASAAKKYLLLSFLWLFFQTSKDFTRVHTFRSKLFFFRRSRHSKQNTV